MSGSETAADGCTKRRHATREDAEAAARLIEQGHGKARGSMTTYRCEVCPADTYHTRNRSKKYRGQEGKRLRRLGHEVSMEARLDPRVVAQLRGEA